MKKTYPRVSIQNANFVLADDILYALHACAVEMPVILSVLDVFSLRQSDIDLFLASQVILIGRSFLPSGIWTRSPKSLRVLEILLIFLKF